MENILISLEERIKEITEIKYVDEDWGQLNFYGTEIPVQFPCVLFDVKEGVYDNIGKDRSAVPQARQMGKLTVDVLIGNLKLTNTSGRAPLSQKNKAWHIYTLEKLVHEKLQGFSPALNCSALIRESYRTIKRDDGVQEKHVIYSFEITNC